ncbi:hypothetical protein HMPREF9137_0294 [Prevotella denticola F0289]|nr:hypothetical protein HMPREF9137_0294 [Prevotella denticola F0289]
MVQYTPGDIGFIADARTGFWCVSLWKVKKTWLSSYSLSPQEDNSRTSSTMMDGKTFFITPNYEWLTRL